MRKTPRYFAHPTSAGEAPSARIDRSKAVSGDLRPLCLDARGYLIVCDTASDTQHTPASAIARPRLRECLGAASGASRDEDERSASNF